MTDTQKAVIMLGPALALAVWLAVTAVAMQAIAGWCSVLSGLGE